MDEQASLDTCMDDLERLAVYEIDQTLCRLTATGSVIKNDLNRRLAILQLRNSSTVNSRRGLKEKASRGSHTNGWPVSEDTEGRPPARPGEHRSGAGHTGHFRKPELALGLRPGGAVHGPPRLPAGREPLCEAPGRGETGTHREGSCLAASLGPSNRAAPSPFPLILLPTQPSSGTADSPRRKLRASAVTTATAHPARQPRRGRRGSGGCEGPGLTRELRTGRKRRSRQAVAEEEAEEAAAECRGR
ncbi:hypothetical protein MC885_018548 [Smutsia gigantea]|nr:hypothetical protein MC885_018548 [Smutsia gigantea]